jgi:multidrug efflux pump subunit AcrB
MATSLAFGVLFTTGITLFLVPAGYLILHDLLDREPQPEPTIG